MTQDDKRTLHLLVIMILGFLAAMITTIFIMINGRLEENSPNTNKFLYNNLFSIALVYKDSGSQNGYEKIKEKIISKDPAIVKENDILYFYTINKKDSIKIDNNGIFFYINKLSCSSFINKVGMAKGRLYIDSKQIKDKEDCNNLKSADMNYAQLKF